MTITELRAACRTADQAERDCRRTYNRAPTTETYHAWTAACEAEAAAIKAYTEAYFAAKGMAVPA